MLVYEEKEEIKCDTVVVEVSLEARDQSNKTEIKHSTK